MTAMQTQRKILMIYLDAAKEHQTTHWDLDYMTSAELEAAMDARRAWQIPNSSSALNPVSSIFEFIKRLFPNRSGQHA